MLSDCEKCWDTPCQCGWEFRDYSDEALEKFILSTVNEKRKQNAIEILQKALEKVYDRK